MTIQFPNAMRVFLVTTSLGEEISLSAIDETQAKRIFMQSFPRKRYATIKEIEPS